ncbi:MAG: aldehyde ferredoxin oxidoreductase family protein [Chloroflexota bacterium]
MYGAHGKILHIDLSSRHVEVEQPSENFYRTYMGGSALGLTYILQSQSHNYDALDPENLLTISLSIITGTPISGQSRITINARSPLTKAIGDSQAGGFFPAEFKFSGYDALILKGKSESPVYLWIHDGEVEIRDARHLWGMMTGDCEDAIRAELGDDKIEVLQIGPAGERKVRFASIMNMSSRANGRTGMGAVMGSKNLKAVAVRGKLKPKIANPEVFQRLARDGAKRFPESNILGLGLYGTAGSMGWQIEAGGLPTNNWSSGYFDEWEALSGQTMAKTILKQRETCFACVVRCKRVVEINDADLPVHSKYGGPEYETLATFGSYCGNSDLKGVAYLNQLCNMYGMDSISCGATIAWVIDCYERGILTQKDLDGINLHRGNIAAMVQLVKKIGEREGIGDILAEGSAKAVEHIGKGSAEFLVTARNQELPAHMPQVKRSLALIYAVNPFGADHQSHEHDPSYRAFPERMAELGLTNPQPDTVLNREKVEYALITQYAYSALDTLNLCQFIFGPAWQLYSMSDVSNLVNAISGWDTSIGELLQLGRRRLNLMRVFNQKSGFTRQDDFLPKKLYTPLVGGVSDGLAGKEQELEQAKDIYYQLAGWDTNTGNPTPSTLVELGLDWIDPGGAL